MRGAISMLAVVVGLGCRPTAPTAPSPPPPSAPRAGTTGTPGTGTGTGTDTAAEPTAPPAAGLPRTCTTKLEVLVPSASGHGSSKASFEIAKQDGWTQACVELRRSADLDCHDRERVAIASERSSSMLGPNDETHWEYDVTFGVWRIAEGSGDAPYEWEACRRARDHACEQLLGGPCPERNVRVLSVDGKPPSAAPVKPVRKAPVHRETI